MVELIKMTTKNTSSTERVFWSIYTTSSTYDQLVCCINMDIVNLTIFQNDLLYTYFPIFIGI